MGHGTVAGGSVTTLVATNFNVRITSPGIDSTITIKEVDDLDIVEAMLKKVRRLVIAQGEVEGKSGA